MPAVEDYEYQHPWATPEPHVYPGYTGYLPGYGPRRRYQMAQTYGHMTHDIMSRHPMAGRRLAQMLDDEEGRLRELENSYLVWNRQFDTNDLRLRDDIITGYTGYIPRSMYVIGKGYTPGSKEATAEFEKLQLTHRKDREPLVLPPQDVLPRVQSMPEFRPHERNRWGNDCKWTQFPNYHQYSQSPYDMSDLNPRKRYMPGFTGYHTGKRFDTAVTYATGVNKDLCDFTNYCIERRVLSKRPTIHDWYQDSGVRPTDKIRLDAYTHQAPRMDKLVPRYTGFVPGYRSGYGGRFGRIAQNFVREHELKFISSLRDTDKNILH